MRITFIILSVLVAGCATTSNPPSVTADPSIHSSEPFNSTGRTYVVQKGDTYWSIAKKSGTTVEALRRSNPGIEVLEIGKNLNLPESTNPSPKKSDVIYTPASESRFIKPVRNGGRVEPHDSKAVAISATHGEDVLAAKSGKVSFIGAVPGYGNVVMIKHSDGFVSIYGQSASVQVEQGQSVRQGQAIAKVGGRGPSRILFMLFKNDAFVNPASYIR